MAAARSAVTRKCDQKCENRPCGRTRSRPIVATGADMMRMEKSTAKPGKQPVQEPGQEPVQEPAKIGSVDVEAFAHNLARLIEEGGKALAAYLKPREEGKIKDETGRRRHRRGQDRRPGGGILAVRPPARARTADQPRPRLSRSVGQRGQAHGRRSRPSRSPRPTRRTSASPIRNGRRTSSSISSSRPICSPPIGPSIWSRTPKASTSTRGRRPSSTSSRSPTRSRRRISC